VRILLVEDEPAVNAAVRSAPVAEGHAVDGTADGAEAFEWAATYSDDLVVLDVGLPLARLGVLALLRESADATSCRQGELRLLRDLSQQDAGRAFGADELVSELAELNALVCLTPGAIQLDHLGSPA
jgi:CheY-like chemotaxis protein